MKDKVTNSNDIFPMRVCFTMQDRCLSFSSCGAVVSVIARGTNGRLRQPKKKDNSSNNNDVPLPLYSSSSCFVVVMYVVAGQDSVVVTGAFCHGSCARCRRKE